MSTPRPFPNFSMLANYRPPFKFLIVCASITAVVTESLDNGRMKKAKRLVERAYPGCKVERKFVDREIPRFTPIPEMFDYMVDCSACGKAELSGLKRIKGWSIVDA
ncbi:hypothetical protein PRZ48_012411 [Zasmidium cellare]|uniref:Uncharacterized protein n=1 Tax=Zasmidium cellare TaxID=395010 RepID=A0ABR0E5C4_ZASCE|nr:hypothetical protein PRZ48_012411 [Zasmidium cellare]